MKKLFILSMICVVFAMGCQLSGTSMPTAIAQTQFVAPTATLMPSPTATVTFTPTPIPPTLSTLKEVPCRAGPGDQYDLIVNLKAEQTVEIVGKAEAFWIVKLPADKECWVPNEQVSMVGEVSNLPIVAPPSTPIPVLPASPAHVWLLSKKCSVDHSVKPIMYVNEFRLTWADMSNNEDGFRVYRDGDLVAEVSANVNNVSDIVSRRNPRSYSYYVSAYNEVGESKSDTIVLNCGK
jgi:hypothetical protein